MNDSHHRYGLHSAPEPEVPVNFYGGYNNYFFSCILWSPVPFPAAGADQSKLVLCIRDCRGWGFWFNWRQLAPVCVWAWSQRALRGSQLSTSHTHFTHGKFPPERMTRGPAGLEVWQSPVHPQESECLDWLRRCLSGLQKKDEICFSRWVGERLSAHFLYCPSSPLWGLWMILSIKTLGLEIWPQWEIFGNWRQNTASQEITVLWLYD